MVDVPVRMPKMSMTMTEGEVVGWQVVEGQHVARGDVVCEVLTDKVDMEVEAPAAGVVRRILHAEGVVAVGEPIGVIEADEGEDTVDLLSDGDLEPPSVPEPPAAPEPPSVPEPPEVPPAVPEPPSVPEPPEVPPAVPEPPSVPEPPEVPRPPAPASVPARHAPGRTAASVAAVPRARALATRLGVDITRVSGSGPGGLVREDDVRAVGDAAAGRPRRRDPRVAYARRMDRSAAVPQLTVREDVPVGAVAAGRGGVSWTTVLLRALSAGLRAVPDARRMWVDGELGDVAEDVAVSLAVAVPGGGVVGPVLVDADLAGDVEQVRELDARLRRTVSLARRGRVESALARPATATLSNVGGLGIASADALVAPPQAAVLTAGALRQALLPPGSDGGQPAWSPVLPLSLTLDHRVVDGVTAAALLAEVRSVLSQPARALGRVQGVEAA
jgi:pyruvate dehydrogenase E2 component (dihydrolipoamide acetyltransferase)